MKEKTAGKIKFGVWGLICGAIITMIVGFAWGGWSTAASTQTVVDDAVLASQAAICVAQFANTPDYEAKLAEFSELGSWKREKFIEAGGWDKMPGQDKADYGVARSCTRGIALLLDQ